MFERLHTFRKRWANLTLAQKFAVSGALYTLPALLLCGVLTTTIVTNAMVERHAGAIAAVISNALTGFGGREGDRSDYLAIFQHLTAEPDFLAQFPYVTIWGLDGDVEFSNLHEVGPVPYDLPIDVAQALAGSALADFTDMNSAEFRHSGLTADYLEIYVPITDPVTGAVVAAMQLRESTAPLERVLMWVTLTTWAAIGSSSAIVITGLYGIVRSGSRTIQRQHRALQRRLSQSQYLAKRYRQLKEEAQVLSRNVTRFTDEHLRTIGTDLHDGPAQNIALAVLNIEQVRRAANKKERAQVLDQMEAALGEALRDMRDIAAGLVLPELEHLDLHKVIQNAVDLHIRHTGCVVTTTIDIPNIHASQTVSVCVFRFVQEGLNNGFHHGLAEGIAVTAACRGSTLTLSVENRYVEGERSTHASESHGLGLHGLRARVQSIGGKFTFIQEHGLARMQMWLNLRRLDPSGQRQTMVAPITLRPDSPPRTAD
ncbi:sensor histidine kinase [Devosia albogilva]|uniref:histidine kinase n=1 Tax=Devosia albogilva TaxID=429726 RepID=A0ABW5QM90_9HYPH